VLSKLRYVETEVLSSASCDAGPPTAQLQAALGTDLVGLHPITGGTLGICFEGELQGHRRFFKTHAVPAGRSTVEREVMLLKATAGDRIDARVLHVGDGDSRRIWLHTKVLQPSAPLTPAAVLNLIADYEAALCALDDFHQVPRADNIHLLLSEAELALVSLSNLNLLSPSVQEMASAYLARVRAVCNQFLLQLCHGDLGPANILTDEVSAVVVDWEDAFWGIAGYDYLYWLTFFSNRKWLLRDSLGHTPLGRSDEIAVMVLILLLKSQLSIRTGSYRHNSISFDQRLLEVIDLD
jgi:hypothetical protein